MCDEFTNRDEEDYLRQRGFTRREFAAVGMGAALVAMLPPVANALDVIARGVKAGLLYGERTAVRVAIAQADIGLLRARTDGVSVQLADRPGLTFAARIVRELPGATRNLPSAALGTAGGGTLEVDPQDPDGRRLLEPVFQLELAVDEAGAPTHSGGRAYVRFEHGRVPLAQQFWQRLRQLLLRHLGI